MNAIDFVKYKEICLELGYEYFNFSVVRNKEISEALEYTLNTFSSDDYAYIINVSKRKEAQINERKAQEKYYKKIYGNKYKRYCIWYNVK